MRKPNPFIPFFCPPEWRMQGNARLDGETVDIVQMFSEAEWDDLQRIEILGKDGAWFSPWREGDPFVMKPYPGPDAPGMLTRKAIEDEHQMTDDELETKVGETLGVTISFSGEDTPEKQFLRWNAYDRLIDSLSNWA